MSKKYDEEEIKKKYGWIVSLWRRGQLVPLSYVKSKKIEEEFKRERKEVVMCKRYEERVIERMSIYPKEKKIILDVSNRKNQSGIRLAIQVIIGLIRAEEIYMYDPIGSNQGYKWYTGQPVIVYQIIPEMEIIEKMKVMREVRCTYYEKYSLEDKWRIIIQSVKGEIEGYKRYDLGGIDKDIHVGIMNAFNGIENLERCINSLSWVPKGK